LILWETAHQKEQNIHGISVPPKKLKTYIQNTKNQ
jgi:hypothetical protein